MTGPPAVLLPHLRRARDLADRRFAEPLDLDALAATAAVSKYHFTRCFAATYGETPMRYLTRRRIERAQDLLRAANLTVTEVCMVVGFSSLGSFSSRFRGLVGESPSDYRDRGMRTGGPRIPGCFLFMRGVVEPLPGASKDRNPGEARGHRRPYGDRHDVHAAPGAARSHEVSMITNVSLVTVYVTDQDAAKDFYVSLLGLEERNDITMGEGFRWVTVGHPNQPELELTLMVPGPPLDPPERMPS